MKIINRNTLKLIAMITMVIDHIAAYFLNPSSSIFYTFRFIGRISFPIICFLLVEGYFHTSNFKKYTFRLALFALISEIVHNLIINNSIIFLDSQNVLFTLLIGLLVMNACTYVKEKFKNRILVIFPIIIGCILANYIRCEYDVTGIIYIAVLFIFKDQKIIRNIAFILIVPIMICYTYKLDITLFKETISYVVTRRQFWSILALLPINFYNGEKGRFALNKYIFYWFYPIHLFILYIIKIIIF